MTYQNLKEFIDAYPSCHLCGRELASYIRSDGSPSPAKLKYFRNINSKLTDNSFMFRIDWVTQTKEFHGNIVVNIKNNTINCDQSMESAAEIFNFSSLRLEKTCLCNNYFLMSDFLIASTEGRIHDVKLDAEIVVINKDLTAITYPYTKNTLVYHSDNEKSYPVSIPKVDFNPQDKEKQFNRIQTIVNFS